MNLKSACDCLNELCDGLFGPDRTGRRPHVELLGALDWPIDVSRPNIHENKADFNVELEAVEMVLENIQSIRAATDAVEGIEERVVGTRSLAVFLTVQANPWPYSRPNLKTPVDLVRQNAKDFGFYDASQGILEDMGAIYLARLAELKSQEAEFWSDASRPPNHYARTIALRFAKLYARQTLRKPTIGTSSQGSHPSTGFGRALEQVFDILEISANFRNVGKWAIGELTQEDWTAPPKNHLLGLMDASYAYEKRVDGRNSLATLAGSPDKKEE